MVLGFCTTCRNLDVNTLVDLARELDKLAGTQDPARGSNAKSNEALTKAPSPPKTPTPPLDPHTSENFFTIFMKMFIETIQAWDQK